ncbi:MAG: MFS transporter [Chthoniobacteraceae bacterium]
MKPSIYPPGTTNANWFSLFNAVSFQITLGAPMILYAKSIGANATTLGVIAALTPLLTICQIPAAYYLERVGYKRMIFYGWGLRTIFIFGIGLVPFMSFASNGVKIGLILFALFVFNLLRGVSSGAWLPWLTELIPDGVRGRFFTRDQFFLQFGSIFAVIASALLLSEHSQPWQFSAVFMLSALGGWVSLLCLKRIPDIEPGEKMVNSNVQVPWRAIVTFPPFLKFTVFILLYSFSAGSAGVFGIALLKSKIGYGESVTLGLTTLYYLGALISLPMVGKIIESTSSRTVLRATTALFCALFVGWSLLAAEVIPPSWALIGLLYFGGGIAGGNFAVAQTRLLMDTMPELGRTHFFALFTVITSLGLSIAPVAWGMMIDTLHDLNFATGPLHWNRFSIYYSLQLLLLLISLGVTGALHEKTGPTPPTSQRDWIFLTRMRRMMRFWQR